MSCYGCQAKFSFFTREYPCPSCGISYCSRCLKQRVTVSEEEKFVCKNCFIKLNADSNGMTSSSVETPDALLKRLETLENPAKPPITIFRHCARLLNLRKGLSPEDKKILERLEKLREDDHAASALPDENEIKRRLARLQDRSTESLSNPQQSVAPLKTQEEEVEELLNRFVEEISIDVEMEATGNKSTDEIECRLKKLQMLESALMKADSSHQDLEDDESETMRIVKRAIAEVQLEKKLKASMKQDDSDLSDIEAEEAEEEMPWCIICNEDAQVRCFGCDGNLYCDICFHQGHEFFDMDDHKNIPYTKRDTLSEE